MHVTERVHVFPSNEIFTEVVVSANNVFVESIVHPLTISDDPSAYFAVTIDIYSSRADNWATCDLLTFHIKGNEEKYYNLTLEYINSELPFRRRIGMYILFYFVDDDKYINKIFDLLNRFENEDHYYVNMMNSWLLSECFIKQREKTLVYLNNNELNKFTLNKGIQKCRESRRVSLEDKEMLLKHKR